MFTFANEPLAHIVGGGSRHVEKGRLRTLSSTIKLRNFERKEDTATEASTSGVYYTLPMAARPCFVMLSEAKHLTQCQGDGRL